jgi:hypothetical protein
MIPADSDVRAVLEAALGGPVGGIARRPSPFRTSFALEEVDVEVDGSVVELMFKDLSEAGLGEARAAKPAFLYDPLREIEIYRDVLGPADLGTPRFEAADVDRRWLFVERVRGVELFQVGRRATWEHVARWVGRLHRELAGVTPPRALCHDAGFYARKAEPRRGGRAGRGDRAAADALAPIAGRYAEVVERLVALPRRSSTASSTPRTCWSMTRTDRHASPPSTGDGRPRARGHRRRGADRRRLERADREALVARTSTAAA